MSKKNFKNMAQGADRLFSKNDTQNIEHTENTQDIKKENEYYRLNLKLKAEYKEYLKDESWKARMSITEYLNNLIKNDMLEKDKK